jgi:hypothetical protein
VFPCGSRSHTTYLTATPQDGGKHVELAIHNLGRLTNKYHTMAAAHQYLPFVVTGVDPGVLPSILEKMINAYVRLGDLDTSTQLSVLYDQIKASGTLVTDSELSRRFVPMLQQIADNCSIANLHSASQERGMQILAGAFTAFEKQLRALELSYAIGLWNQVGGKLTVDPPITVLCALGELRRAIYLHDLPACEQLLKAEPSCASLVDEEGRTLLHCAVQAGDIKIADLVIRYKTDPSTADRAGTLAVEHALKQPDLLKLLTAHLKVRSVKSYYVLRHTVPFYRQLDMDPKSLITEIEADTQFYELARINEKTMKILLCDADDRPFIGYIGTDLVS